MSRGFDLAAQRAGRGAAAYASGHLAEDQVCRSYEAAGCAILERRWRGRAGEIDLVVRDGETIVFVEVKKAATHAAAAERIQQRQIHRICMAATEYAGLDAEMRFDAALVDQQGQVEVIPNAFVLH